jgi:hypothetical protein
VARAAVLAAQEAIDNAPRRQLQARDAGDQLGIEELLVNGHEA